MPQTDPTPQRLHPTVFDTGAGQVAHVYAQALYGAAAKAGQVDAVIEELDSFVRDVLVKNYDFERVLVSTIIGREDKAATIRRLFEGKASSIFLNLLLVLNDHGRLDLLRSLADQLRAVHDKKLGRVGVEIRTALPLDQAQQTALRDRLVAVVGGQPVVHMHVEPAIIGGLIVRVGDTVFDGSVRTRLNKLRDQLLERSTHEIQSRRDQFSSTT